MAKRKPLLVVLAEMKACKNPPSKPVADDTITQKDLELLKDHAKRMRVVLGDMDVKAGI